MVKSSLKCHKKDKVLEKILDARQVGLKLIANVTFGYTAAHFSGRMPCVEVRVFLAPLYYSHIYKYACILVIRDTSTIYVYSEGCKYDLLSLSFMN